MKCVICSKALLEKKYKPFCSKRCADVDLGNWFSERYGFQSAEFDEEDIKALEDIIENIEE